MKKKFILFAGLLLLPFFAEIATAKTKGGLSIDYEMYTLENGLEVVLHQDKSDPIVAVAIQYHVGSNREVPGRTGFAHLFEHMMFQQSENVGQDQFFRKIDGAGGTMNGGTGNDATTYFEVVPKNALEMVLWLESDRMGYLANTVTRSAFSNQKNVVQNEKRQRVDNRPYGHNGRVIATNLFPEGHPYSWTVIGEMDDLLNATIEDVKAFHAKYYVPNNSTLVIAGDFETTAVKALVEKYFGEIPVGAVVSDPEPMPVTLAETKKRYHEDNFARTPLLTLVWPVPEEYSEDAYALDFLAKVLGNGKKAPFYRVIVKDRKLAPNAAVYNHAQELCGQFRVSIGANAETSLADVEAAVFEAFKLFEEEGITARDLEKHKAGIETDFYNGISSIQGKSFRLASYNEYAGSPDFLKQDIANIQAVTVEDVMRVYQKYIKGKPYLATSFVPRGQLDLIAENSIKANVIEEKITEAAEADQSAPSDDEVIVKTKTAFDRSVEPAKGPDPELKLPDVWMSKADNGMKIWGIEQREVPLVQFSIVMEGGHLMATPEKAGIAAFLANMLMEGTANKTPEELEEAIDLLGARISVRSGAETMAIHVNCLARNFEEALQLVEEMLLEPRWDEEQFGLIKSRMANSIRRKAADPNALAGQTFNKLVYGENAILGVPSDGTQETIASISMADLKAYYKKCFSPSAANIHVVGQIDKDVVVAGLSSLSAHWKPVDVVMPTVLAPTLPEKPVVYFVDVPGAKQSVIHIGGYSIPRSHDDFYPATAMNYKLGGSFVGYVNLILREEKGFTYGARTHFSGGRNFGTFKASSSVRSSATLESVQIFIAEMERYVEGIDAEGLSFTKDALIKSNARKFETLGALHGMLLNISLNNRPLDYVKQEEAFVKGLTLEQHKALALKYITPQHMYYVIVGDAETQLDALQQLGLGTPVLVN